MVRAAAALFAERGFAGTTMDAVASASGMSVQSVYFTFANKASLLQAAFDDAAFVDDHVTPPPLSAWYLAAVAADDADVALTGFVQGVVTILRGTARLAFTAAAAAPADQGAAEIADQNEQLRRRDLAAVTDHLAAKRALRPSLSIEEARDVVFALLSPQLYLMFVGSLGWSDQKYAAFAIRALRADLWGI
jgi:AcrR family transcriptional regulator